MRDLLILFVHVIITLARLARPGGVRLVVTESALIWSGNARALVLDQEIADEHI
jgi:hypothetical protein